MSYTAPSSGGGIVAAHRHGAGVRTKRIRPALLIPVGLDLSALSKFALEPGLGKTPVKFGMQVVVMVEQDVGLDAASTLVTVPDAVRPRSSSTTSMSRQPRLHNRSRMAYCSF